MQTLQASSIKPLRLSDQDTQALKPRTAKKFDKLSTSFLFINCCVGSGVLGLGKILHIIGYGSYIIYQFLSLAFCVFTFEIIARANYHGNFPTISECIKCLWGKAFGLVVDISIVACNMGFLTAYVNVSSDYIREGIKQLGHVDVLGDNPWPRLFKFFTALIIMCPLSMIKSVDALNFVSSFALLFVIVAIIGILIRFFQFQASGFEKFPPHDIPHEMSTIHAFAETGKEWRQTIAYFTTFFTLYTMHANMSPVQRQIAGKPKERLRTVLFSFRLTLPLCLIIYTIACVFGDLMFNYKCEGWTDPDHRCLQINSNILLSFQNDTMMTVFKLLYSIVVMVSFPCMLFPLRETIMAWMSINKDTKQGYFYFCCIGWVISFICCILGIAIPAIDKVFSLTGNIFGIILMEWLGLFIWYKMPLLEKHSFGELLENNINLCESELTEETSSVVQSFVDDVEKMSSQLDGKSQQQRNEVSVSAEGGAGENPDVVQEKATVNRSTEKRRQRAKQAKYVDKYVLRGLYKEKYEAPMWRTVVLYASAIFFLCFNLTAIVFEFV